MCILTIWNLPTVEIIYKAHIASSQNVQFNMKVFQRNISLSHTHHIYYYRWFSQMENFHIYETIKNVVLLQMVVWLDESLFVILLRTLHIIIDLAKHYLSSTHRWCFFIRVWIWLLLHSRLDVSPPKANLLSIYRSNYIMLLTSWWRPSLIDSLGLSSKLSRQPYIHTDWMAL